MHNVQWCDIKQKSKVQSFKVHTLATVHTLAIVALKTHPIMCTDNVAKGYTFKGSTL